MTVDPDDLAEASEELSDEAKQATYAAKRAAIRAELGNDGPCGRTIGVSTDCDARPSILRLARAH